MTKARGSRAESIDERLRESLAYDAETGHLTWRLPPRRGVPSGSIAGCKHNQGYLTIGIGGKRFFCHRVAWFIAHGAWPTAVIDHINGDRVDNRIENLRDVPQRTNCENLRRAKSKNKLGVLGVAQAGKNCFAARIVVSGQFHHLGCFGTKEDAGAAYLAAKRKLHAGCSI